MTVLARRDKKGGIISLLLYGVLLLFSLAYLFIDPTNVFGIVLLILSSVFGVYALLFHILFPNAIWLDNDCLMIKNFIIKKKIPIKDIQAVKAPATLISQIFLAYADSFDDVRTLVISYQKNGDIKNAYLFSIEFGSGVAIQLNKLVEKYKQK